ncbi:MAG: UDP-N-acetylglucosamine--N-acetylmuramyl-(pentapeptide) pyrophosphoryl-undecaprenol N-acetylglucosamine transferase [Candidatus Buchananbacteria bacterium]
MKIIFAGGGTGGSVTPLISIYQEIKKRDNQASFLWLSPKHDPLKNLVREYNLEIKEIASGKLRRYFDWRNFIDPLFIFLGFCQSFFIILKFKPDYIVSAGGFVAVPVSWAGWFLGKKILIHQQDVVPGLANKLMAGLATKITVTFAASLKDFDKNKTVVVGNAVRQEIFSGSKDRGVSEFKLEANLPIVLVVGGGTGALVLNSLTLKALPQLVEFCQIIHITGGKIFQEFSHPRYKPVVFLTKQFKDVLVAADLVVTRAGLGILTESAALKKAILVIPMPHSHQEKNAEEFFRNNAAALLSEVNLTSDQLAQAIKSLLKDEVQLNNYRRNIAKVLPTDGSSKIVDIIYGR